MYYVALMLNHLRANKPTLDDLLNRLFMFFSFIQFPFLIRWFFFVVTEGMVMNAFASRTLRMLNVCNRVLLNDERIYDEQFWQFKPKRPCSHSICIFTASVLSMQTSARTFQHRFSFLFHNISSLPRPGNVVSCGQENSFSHLLFVASTEA